MGSRSLLLLLLRLLLFEAALLLGGLMWEQLGCLDLDLMRVYEVGEVQEEEEVVVDRDYGEVLR